MNLSITFHIPLKARLVKHSNSSEVAFYLGIRRWLFAYGGKWVKIDGKNKERGKQRWIRILGLTFCISWYNLWPIELSWTIQ